jgi:hypothetical protein
LYSNSQFFSHVCQTSLVRLGREIHMTDDAHRFTPAASVLQSSEDARVPEIAAELRGRGYLPLHEGKTFHQYDDRWEAPPRYLVALDALAGKPSWLRPAQCYRLAFRDIASSTNERTGIFCLLPPGVVCGNTAPCEREPHARAVSGALILEAVANSHTFDWTVRLKAASHVNLFILNGCPYPNLAARSQCFLAHSALRLSCNHIGYAPLWTEQVGDEWREPKSRHTWPVLEGDEARWAVRATIDAVVADAYGLNRDQYAHVLSTFSHRSYPKAPERCLAAFDDLKAIGHEAFTKKHDPYWDTPLNESLPKPLIDLPVPVEADPAKSKFGPLFDRIDSAPKQNPISVIPKVPQSPTRQRAVSQAYETIVDLLEERGMIASMDAQAATGLDASAVRLLLKRLVDEGHAVTEGQKRGMKYRRAPHA